MYTVKEVLDKKAWEEITSSVLLQTWSWGEFLRTIGHKIIRLGVYKGNELIAAAQVSLVKSSLRTHLYISNGPVLKGQEVFLMDSRKMEPVAEAILHYLRNNPIHRFINYIRMDPLIIDTSDENSKTLKSLGIIKAATQIQPQHTIIIDLNDTEENLLNDMTKSTRYDIKRGIKENVKITSSTTTEDFDKFWKMYTDTFKRQKFVVYPKSYYLAQMKELAQNNNYKVYLAYDKETPIAGALIAYDKLSSYYLHAGRTITSSEAAKYAPKVLLWKIITDSKEAGKRYFNMYGIAKDESNANDPWNGLTLFKKGFGGTTIHYIGAYDFPLTMNYWFIRILERTRKIWGYPYFLIKQLLRN